MNAEEMEALARRAAAGEGAAMDQLLGALWPVWYAVGLRCLRDPVLAEEAAQETALRVLRGLRRFDFQCSVRTWSIRIVLNASTDQVRRDRRAGAPMADVEPGADRTDPLTRLSVALLLVGGDASSLPAERRAEIGADFRRWTEQLRDSGNLLSQGQLLRTQSIASRQPGNLLPEDREGLAAVNGYFIVRAPTEVDAWRLAETMPYLDMHGSVIVREIARAQ